MDEHLEQLPQRPVSMADMLKGREIKKQKKLRQQFIDEAVARINMERVGTNYKPITARAVAMKLAHIKDDTDLHYFQKRCQQGKSYSKVFFGALKVVK